MTELRKLVERNWKVDEEFMSTDIYKFETHFKHLFPSNRHIRPKLQQTLQYLRDDGLIKFLDGKGTYKRISK